ncbi:hypothetical protein [Gordoniibacillus kamchatkensis]|uniref:hypothetical protein n=1 Tax=Gordoniibacillus kamchatkensis TaxID=1590651 RepID=UPI00069747E6|nr:hypothetical protein [Paenibacillus sp. VKM B-2647]
MKLLLRVCMYPALIVSLAACGAAAKPAATMHSEKPSIQQEAAAASAPASRPSGADSAAAPQNQQANGKTESSQQQSQPQPQTTESSQSQSQPQPQTQPQSRPQPQPQSQSQPQSQPQPQTETASTTAKDTAAATPAAAAKPAADQKPTQAPAESKKETAVQILSVTSPVKRNANAALRAKVAPGAMASIVVHYKSGPSKAAGLEAKKADADGNVSWSWRVGGNTTLGKWRITVSSGSESAETTFEVVH